MPTVTIDGTVVFGNHSATRREQSCRPAANQVLSGNRHQPINRSIP